MASEGHRKSRPVRRQSHKTHSSPSQRERARGTRRWSTGVELHAQRTCGVALAQQPSGLCVQPRSMSPWRALSTDRPGRPSVPRGWARCRLFFVQPSDIGVSWAQRGGVTGQAWAVQVVAPSWQDPFEKAERELQEPLGPRVPTLALSYEGAGRHAVPLQGIRVCGHAWRWGPLWPSLPHCRHR